MQRDWAGLGCSEGGEGCTTIMPFRPALCGSLSHVCVTSTWSLVGQQVGCVPSPDTVTDQ